MKTKPFFLVIFFLAFFIGSLQWVNAQNAGDYRSVATGDWSTLSTWERYDGTTWNVPTASEGYPGEVGGAGTGNVNISTGDVVTISYLTSATTLEQMGTVTVETGALLEFLTDGNQTVFYFTTLEIFVESGPPTGIIDFGKKTVLYLPENAVLFVGLGGLTGACNNNVEIFIGGLLFASCKGAPGDIYTFEEIMNNGGTLNAIIEPIPTVCLGETIVLNGDYSGAAGTTEPNGSISGVNYNWEVTHPDNSTTTSSSQIYSIPNANLGNYAIKLSITTYNEATMYTNAETTTLSITQETPGITGKNPVSNFETGVVYSTEVGRTDYNWSFTGPPETTSGPGNGADFTVNWGEIGTGTLSVYYTDLNGCISSLETVNIDIVEKQSAADASWDLDNTWSPSGVPTMKQQILINDAVVIDGVTNAECDVMTIESGGSIQINPGSSLTVNSTLTNNVGASALVIESDATGTGSLIHNSDGVNAQVKQYLTGNEWHYVTSPMTSAVSGVFTGIYLKPFDESIDDWGPYIVPTTVPMPPMQGFAAWAVAPTTVTFSGTLNNGTKSIPVTRNTTEIDQGWNLVGNPYPSSIDWDAASGWTKSNVDNTIYFWEGVGDGGGGNYHYYQGEGGLPGVGINDGSKVIPPSQGFFVHASADGTLGVANQVRIHGDQEYWKSSEALDIPQIRLLTSSVETGFDDEALIRFYPEASRSYDGEYDAIKLEGYLVPQIYSITEAKEKLAINTLPNYFKGTVIPIGFTCPEGTGQYTIKLTEFENIKPGFTLYLEDLFNDSMRRLTEDDVYLFTASSTDDPNRFMLHFVLNKYVVYKKGSEGSNIYSYRKSVYVNIEEAVQTNITVYNLMGQKVAEYSTGDQGLFKADLDCEPGYYVVRAQSSGQVSSQKVFIQ